MPLGSPIEPPDFIKFNRGLVNFSADDHLCFFSLFDLPELEDFYQINFVIYELDNAVAKLVQTSQELYAQTMKLNLFKHHASLIKNFDTYCHVFQCTKCDHLFNQHHDLTSH